MALVGFHGSLGVADTQGREDQSVLLLDPRPSGLAAELDGPIDVGGIPQLLEEPHQPGPPRALDDREVERPVGQGQ